MAQPNSTGGKPILTGGPILIRPEQIDRIPNIEAEKKAQWKSGLAKLWQQHESHPEGTPQRHSVETQIRNASGRIMADISIKGRPGSSTQQQQQQQQGQQRPGTGGQPTVGQSGQVGSAGAGGVPAQPAPGQQANAAQAAFSPAVRHQLGLITVHMPPSMNPQQQSSYRQRWYSKAAAELTRREQATATGRSLTQRMAQMKTQGQEIPPQMEQQLENQRKVIREADNLFGQMKAKNEEHGRSFAAQQNTQGAANSQGNAARMEGSPQQPLGNFQQAPSNVASNAANLNLVPQQQPQASQAQTPQSTTQQNFPSAQFPQQHPNQQPQHSRPNAQQVPPPHMPTPNTAAPPQQAPQRPQALTHQAAISQADIGRVQPQQGMPPHSNLPQPPQPQVPNGLPFTNVPQSATATTTPSSAFATNMQPTQPPTNKFPIAKQLQLDPRTQQPVQGPPSRPTLSNAGMITQPGNVRPQPFTLEGEGDRVLSKRKLDELVRQVTGRTAADELEPAVEEAMLDLADDFVDDLITSACRLAKLRANQTLDIKDIQIVLERNYGIRVPGYSLDEVRTVRKFQPAPGWQSKMQAIQTAKTLGGVGGKGDS